MAIDAANTAGGGKVHFPQGTYKIVGGLTFAYTGSRVDDITRTLTGFGGGGAFPDSFKKVTLTDTTLFADGTAGNDTNDGLTVGAPVKTLAKLKELIANLGGIAANVTIDLRGTFTNPGVVFWYIELQGGNVRVIGNSADAVVDDNGGPGFSITASASSTVTAGAAAWTPDAFRGYHALIVGGTADGERALIHANTATQLQVDQPWDTLPVGGTVKIVKPGTVIHGTSGFHALFVTVNRLGPDDSWCYVQNLNFTGATQLAINNPLSGAGIAQCVMENNAFGTALSVSSVGYGGGFYFDGFAFDATFAFVKAPGVSQIHASSKIVCTDVAASMFYLVAQLLQFTNCRSVNMGVCRARQITAAGTKNFATQGFSGYAPMRVDGSSADGISLIRSEFKASFGVLTVENNTGNGIKAAVGSIVELSAGPVAGSGNGGAGVDIDTLSVCTFPTGATPTITGTAGDARIAAATATWASIAAGTPLVDTTEQSVVKKR